MLKKISKILDDNDVEYSEREIENLIQRCYSVKEGLKGILSLHPSWREDELAICLSIEEERSLNANDIWNAMENLLKYANKELTLDYKYRDGLGRFRGYQDQFINGSIKESLETYSGIKATVGKKTSRTINSICIDCGISELPDYNKLFAKVADSFNPIIQKRKAILSINPCDYLTMSNGNGWDSCHTLDGDWCGGTLSYLEDKVTMIFYTVADEHEDKFYSRPKITRQVFCYDNSQLLQSRPYPQGFTTSFDLYGKIVNEIFIQCTREELKKAERNVVTGPGALQYEDYYHPNQWPIQFYSLGHKPPIIVGAEAHCLKCGEIITEHGSLHCDDCGESWECHECGSRIDSDDRIRMGGNNYCSDCVMWCERCEEYSLNDDATYIEDYGCVCQSCLENHYCSCDECGNYFDKDNITNVNSTDYCSSCLEDHCSMCDVCEEYDQSEDMLETADGIVCSSCAEDYTQCDHCAEYFKSEDIIELGDMSYCSSCVEEYHTCKDCGVITQEERCDQCKEERECALKTS